MVAQLVGEPEPGVPDPDVPSILVAEDLAPADTAGLDPERRRALVTERGGPTSHTAIIARQLGIPCVVGAAGALEIRDGTPGSWTVRRREGTSSRSRGRGGRPSGRRVTRGPRRAGAVERSWPHQGRHAVKLLANVAIPRLRVLRSEQSSRSLQALDGPTGSHSGLPD